MEASRGSTWARARWLFHRRLLSDGIRGLANEQFWVRMEGETEQEIGP